jgi:aryl-alcohol dehydrogenase-like predicted oxidoreductase
MRLGRREFIVKSALGMGAGLTASGVGFAQQGSPTSFDPYERVPLGKTGLVGSRVSFGTGMKGWMRESNQTRLGKEELESLIRAAYDRGIRVFDLADLYGSHPYIASALKDIDRGDYVIITKIWWKPRGLPEKDRPDPDVIVPRFLKELQTDYIDAVLLHCVDSPRWPQKLRKQMDILAALKDKGLIRAHGVSCHSLGALEAAAAEPWVDTVNARINPYGVKMDGPAEKVAPVLQKLHEAGKGVVGMKLIGEGAFRDDDEKRDRSVKYVLGLGCVDVLNVGFESTEEIDDFAARVRRVPRATA